MKCMTVFSFILTTFEIYISTASSLLQIVCNIYVLPDNLTTGSCPSQSYATLSQYWLHNITLPVVSK